MNYVQLCEEEYQVLQMLAGEVSLREIKTRLERTCFPARISLADIQQLLGRLNAENLLLVEAYSQEQTLLEQRRDRRKRERLSVGLNLLAIRLPGINPAPLLDLLYPSFRWTFSSWAMVAGALLICIAGLLAVVQFDALLVELPTFQEFVAPRNIAGLALALMAAKGLHELAHGLTCKHFGGTCHEFGVMFLAFTPCLYCNVSDSWMFSNRWHRVAVSLAGIYVELVLAAVCTFLWWWSETGLLHWICLDLMFVCCVSTILVNGNPLLKYDGYYVLSDLANVPNLRQQANQTVEQIAGRLFWGVSLYSPRAFTVRGRWLLSAYWLAAFTFRVLVLIGVLWTCHKVLRSYQLEFAARALTAAVLTGTLVATALSIQRISKQALWRHGNRVRASVVGAGLVTLAWGVMLIPWPSTVGAPALFWPLDSQNVYASVGGELVPRVSIGETVARGQVIAQLVDLETRQELLHLAGRCNLQRLHVQNLEVRRTHDPAAGNELPTAREVLAGLQARLKEKQLDWEGMTIISPTDGVILPPPFIAQEESPTSELAKWHGCVLEPRNKGALLDIGTLVCYVGNTSQMEAMLVIDERARPHVRAGQTVRIRVAALGNKALTGTISEIAPSDFQSGDSQRLVSASAVANLVTDVPVSKAVYYARVALQEVNQAALCGVGGRARITIEPRSLLRRSLDYINHTFRFRL